MRVPVLLAVGVGLLLVCAPAATLAQRPSRPRAAPIERRAAVVPLSPRERTEQLLDRFTYGPRPGEVDRVLTAGPERWFEQQLQPASIPDGALSRRLADLPTVAMTPAQALAVFPDRTQVAAVAQGKVPMPTDPLQRGVMDIQVVKWTAEQDRKKTDTVSAPGEVLTEEQKAAQKKADQATASRIAGALFALPKEQRMTALLAMPVEDRIAFTANGNLQGQQRTLLLNDLSPREREAFQAMSAQVSSSGNLGNELAQAHVLRDILSERQVEAVMTDLWFNHFNVFLGKDSDQWYTASYERDVIRPHALGKFRDLLLATATAPAMLVYLDNLQSIGPDSLANGVNPANPKSKRGNRGLNENYGRELMELHTLGVNGGYSQADVTALAAILTGWGVDKPQDGGPFLFDPKRHQPGTKVWFGNCIGEDGSVTRANLPAQGGGCPNDGTASPAPSSQASMQQGIAALRVLAASPKTAHFIAEMLVRYFVADTPPPALVTRVAQVYGSTDGDIRQMLRTIVASPEFNDRRYFHNKVKTPAEFIASAFRTTGTDPQNPGALVGELRTMGMPLYGALPPTGYLLTADAWMNSTALVNRLNFAAQLTGGKLPNQRFDAPKLLAAGLLSPGTLPPESQPVISIRGAAKTGGQDAEGAAWRRTSAPVAGTASPDAPEVIPSAGMPLAAHVLERVITGGEVSAKTDALVRTQVTQQPATANAADTLNLITGLLLGSPEFQVR